MGLDDTVAQSGLAAYPEVALVLFFAVFVLVALRAAISMRADDCARAGSMPLERDDGTHARKTKGDHHAEQ